MTPLRQRMIDDLKLLNRSPRTIESYVFAVAHYAKFHGRSPDQLGAEQVRAYQKHLVDSGASWSRFNIAVAALKFLYGVTLKVTWPVEQIPYGRRPRKLPVVLSQEEVIRLIDAVEHPMCRMALITAYAAGLRITELVALKAEHIDSARMMLHVVQGKGQKARMVPLSEVLLVQLRHYWRTDRLAGKRRPWVFPGRQYLARYTHRVAISDRRILGVHDGTVTFRYRDRKDGQRQRMMTLDGVEFLRRFLLHVLPKGFVRIRYYGLLANRCREDNLARCRELLAKVEAAAPTPTSSSTSEPSNDTPKRCPCCGSHRMRRVRELEPTPVPALDAWPPVARDTS